MWSVTSDLVSRLTRSMALRVGDGCQRHPEGRVGTVGRITGSCQLRWPSLGGILADNPNDAVIPLCCPRLFVLPSVSCLQDAHTRSAASAARIRLNPNRVM